ncbi:MAG: HAD-IA family hydrolase [Anaerolineales bacterium]|nr:HAD-IA family hydrolase [Anaerolineales bacterium]
MAVKIQAILFDMGSTLRRTTEQDPAVKEQKIRELIHLLGAEQSSQAFFSLLSERAAAYHRWAVTTLNELNEAELWTLWMLPDWPAEQIKAQAVHLNQLWREAIGRRDPLPESKAVVTELFRRGYRLGLVSNTTSSTEVPQLLQNLEISGLFETVVLSCLFGKRKGDPTILLEAARRMELKPEHCAYIGDQPQRDVMAARQAGFGQVILLRDPFQPERQAYDDPSLAPDAFIDNLIDLYDYFPRRPARKHTPRQGEPEAWNVSLSTMWARRNFPNLGDFFQAARRMGYAHIELNHQVDSAMLAGIEMDAFRFSSIHEPCPADISTETLKARDWLISADDEDKRRQGVLSIQHSIDLACTLGVGVIVVHSGNAQADLSQENRLRTLYDAGLSGYAGRCGIRLGLENRYHYMDIPSPDELEQLLELADPDRLGFIYDVGHAQAMDHLGFYPHEAWLRRYAPRMLGAHLHDVIGVTDHYAPGLGEIDFAHIAPYLPSTAFRTLELHPKNTPEQVHAGLRFLATQGCVHPLETKEKSDA